MAASSSPDCIQAYVLPRACQGQHTRGTVAACPAPDKPKRSASAPPLPSRAALAEGLPDSASFRVQPSAAVHTLLPLCLLCLDHVSGYGTHMCYVFHHHCSQDE